MRLIDADALKENMKFSHGMIEDDCVLHVPWREVIKNIDKAPTVGEMTRPVFNGRFWECEECRQRYKDILVVKEYKHCPGCGRKIERWY